MKIQVASILLLFITWASLLSPFVFGQCPSLCSSCARNSWDCSKKKITDQMLLEIAKSGDAKLAESLLLKDNNLTAFPTLAFRNFTTLKKLDLSQNFIEKVPQNLSTYLPSLEEVVLSKNNLRTLKRGAFQGYENIKVLDIFSNNIVSLEPGVFENLPKVTKLFVEKNEVSILRNGLLNGLPELESVSFQGNGLKEVEPGVFSNNKKLIQIWLSKNKLTSLPSGLFDSLKGGDAVYLLDLSSNLLTSEGLPNRIFNFSVDDIILENNNLTTLKKEWFGKVNYDLKLANNPIKCGCYSYQAYLHLLNQEQAFGILGTCASPTTVLKKKLVDVFSKNLNNCTSCSINECKHNSTCTVVDKWKYNCECDDPYYGTFCEKINQCIPSPCLNNATCTNLNGVNFNCTCHAGYSGKTCAIKVKEEKEEGGLKPGYIVLIVLIVLALIVIVGVILYLRNRKQGKGGDEIDAATPLSKAQIA